MEKIVIDHTKNFVHLNLGLSDERVQELEETISRDVMSKAVNNGIITVNEEEGSLLLCASRIIDHLVNKVAQTETERLFLMTQVDSIIDNLDQHIKRFDDGTGYFEEQNEQ